MSRNFVTGACGLALAAMISPAVAQETGAGGATDQTGGSEGQATTGASDQAAGDGQATTGADPRQGATQQAEQVGMQDVSEVQGAFVLQGTSPTATPVFMIVGPNGELLALAAPIAQSGGAGTQTDAQTDTQAGAAESQADAADAPEAGEPAESGYMATQTQPASPNMWDPAQVEGAMQRLEAGEAPAQQ